jgi:hypothetical protein
MGVGQVGKTDEKSTFALSSDFGKQNRGEFWQESGTEKPKTARSLGMDQF